MADGVIVGLPARTILPAVELLALVRGCLSVGRGVVLKICGIFCWPGRGGVHETKA